ncbi:hypothetical protein KC217_24120, partial [Mycobacterium tuberculosis]|nr:hypothetical protein [Mycobacterium tuberculosis]
AVHRRSLGRDPAARQAHGAVLRILAINILSKQYFFLHWIGIDCEFFRFLILVMSGSRHRQEGEFEEPPQGLSGGSEQM